MKHVKLELTEDQFNTIFDFVWEERERLKDVIKPNPYTEEMRKWAGFKPVYESNKKKFAYMTRLTTLLAEQAKS